MDGVKEIILQTKNVEYIKRNLGKEQYRYPVTKI